MFARIEHDGSGRISFDELEAAIRFDLMLKKDPTELQLQALWLALDLDRSGFLDVAEFGAFMRKGAPERGLGWKERRQSEADAKGAAARAEKDVHTGKYLFGTFAEGLEPATDTQVACC